MAEVSGMEATNGEQQGCSTSTVIYGILSFIVTAIIALFVMAIVQENSSEVGWGRVTLMGVPALITGSFFGLIGAAIGDVVRRVACPDMILTSGGMGAILKEKIFWAIGPQLIGISIGSYAGVKLAVYLVRALFKF